MAMFPFANQISRMPVNEDWAFGGGNRYRPGQDPMRDRRLWAPASFSSMMSGGYKGGRAPNPNAEYIPRTAPPGGATSMDMVRNPNYRSPTTDMYTWVGAPRPTYPGSTQPTQKSIALGGQQTTPFPSFSDKRIGGYWNGGQLAPGAQTQIPQQTQPQMGGGLMDMIRSAQGQMPGGGRVSMSAKFGEAQNPGMDFSRMMRGY